MFNKTILNHFCLRKAHITGSLAMEVFKETADDNGGVCAGAVNQITGEITAE